MTCGSTYRSPEDTITAMLVEEARGRGR